eukprot:RCo051259
MQLATSAADAVACWDSFCLGQKKRCYEELEAKERDILWKALNLPQQSELEMLYSPEFVIPLLEHERRMEAMYRGQGSSGGDADVQQGLAFLSDVFRGSQALLQESFAKHNIQMKNHMRQFPPSIPEEPNSVEGLDELVSSMSGGHRKKARTAPRVVSPTRSP